MTLDEMCIMAARYSDRYDEFEKNGDGEYEDDALHYFNVFRDGINEAYREVSREQALPDCYGRVVVEEESRIDLTKVQPAVFAVKDLFNSLRTVAVGYNFVTKYLLHADAQPGEELWLYYHYMPDELVELDDSPIFSEALVDPMIYVSLAVARMWYSEKKFDYGDRWMAQYRQLLRSVRNSLKDRSGRRIPRRLFR